MPSNDDFTQQQLVEDATRRFKLLKCWCIVVMVLSASLYAYVHPETALGVFLIMGASFAVYGNNVYSRKKNL